MNRADFQQLAKLRINEAKIFFNSGCYEGAYYLAGYAVECAQKACIAKQTNRYDFPDKKIVKNIFTHKFIDLIGLAGLEVDLKSEQQSNKGFGISWSIVSQWSEEARYDPAISASKADELITAINNRTNGVLPWLKKHW